MGSKWVLVLVLFMFVSLQGCLSQISGCWEEERVALLQLKHFFNDPNSLQDWVEGDQHNNSDCCQWEKVKCNNSTGRVISLYLEYARDWDLREGWYLNASLFSAFEQLEELDLWGNSIAGFVDNGGLDKLSRLRNLEYLDLGHNMFNNDILSSLNALPSLTSLYLFVNRLNETVDLQGLDSCKNLNHLDLGGNQIERVVFPKGLDKLSTLTNLEFLGLGGNMFNNDILSSINALPSLKSLYLYENRLNETVDLQVLHSCKNLTEMDLSYNKIEKVVIPKGLDKLSTLTNLELLGLEGNMFNNDIFSSINALPSLKSLYLSYNRLNETVDLQGLDSCKNLKNLYLSYNQIEKAVFPKGSDKLSILTNLEFLGLGGNMFNNDIFSSINALPSLKYLDLYENRLNGTVDLQGLDSCKNLNHLSLSHNQIERVVFPKGLDKQSTLINLDTLNLGGNMLNNDILSSINALPSLKYLFLYENRLNETVDLQGLHSYQNLTELDLSNNQMEKVVFPKGLDSLEYLDVGYNPFEKFIFPKGSTGLRKLKTLDLNGLNVINGSSLLQSLGSFPSLKTLYIRYSNFSDSTTNRDYLRNLTNVEELMLDESFLHISLLQSIAAFTSLNSLGMFNCQINGILGFQDLPSFKNLTYLYMDDTSLDINVLQIVEEMTSLEFLSLSNCGLQDTLSHQGLCECVHLQELYLSDNNLMGTLPSCFANLTSLRVLDVSSNNFTGDISLSPVKSLISIQELRLSNNHFQIPPSLAPLFNLSKLKEFYGENNEIINAETESHSSAPKFQLNTIMLSCCGDGGKLPEFLHHQHDLQKVDLSHNNLTGEFPNWLLENNTKLEYLVLANNSLAGLLQLPNHSLMGLNISHNLFQGPIPKQIGEYLPSLISLNLSRNAFDGSIPSSIGDMNSLESLDLSFNQLSGEIPDHLAEGCTSLQLLVLSNNSIQGQIFSTNFNLTNLLRLQLDSNNFTGRIPDSLYKASNLAGLYLSDNKLSGGIPSWLGNISSLEDIIMPNNHLEGPIPLEFCRLDNLEVLDLTGNNISGSLPSCFSPPSITQVHLSKNRLDGQLKEVFYNSSSLVTLDLGYNRFDGNIPTWIGRLSQLTYLTLSNNNLEGEVPTQLCQLNQLRLIDLSHNNLFGHIPPCLDLTALHDRDHDIVSPFDSPSMPPTEATAYAPDSGPPMRKEETVEFITKNNSYFYQGKVLTYMSGIDLSCNNLTGLIPQQIGNLTRIRTLNLSHNNFTGPIPPTFAKLRQIESLDLSYNNLNGKIPPQLVELNYMSFFSVAHNNLSRNIPKSTQFCTYGDNGFEGNPFLYGLPLSKSCDTTTSPSSPMPRASTDNGEDNDLFDMDIFYISFTVSYIIGLLGIAAVLYINPYWRRSWFYLVETRMTSCYYFVVDNLPRRLRH